MKDDAINDRDLQSALNAASHNAAEASVPIDVEKYQAYLDDPKFSAEEREEIIKASQRLKAIGVPAGVLSPDHAFCDRLIDAGVTFLAVDLDVGILTRGTAASRQRFS